MDKLYLDFDENGLLTMHIEGDIDKFKSTLKFKNNKYFFGVEKRLIKDKNLIDKLKYEHVSLIPKVGTINAKQKKKTEPTNEEKYEVRGLPDDIIFDGKDFYSLVPLEWTCNNGKYFTCLNTTYTKSTVISLLKKRFFDISVMNDYLNDTILPKIFDVKEVERISIYEASYKVFNEVLEKIELPNYTRKIDISYENGKMVLEKSKTLIKIDIPEEVRIIKCSSDDLKFREHILYNIFIPKTVKYIEELLVNYNGKINLLAFDKNFDGVIVNRSLISLNEINSLKIPCSRALFRSIISIGSRGFIYIFDKNSKLTLTYENENVLFDFFNYFVSLDEKLDNKNNRRIILDRYVNEYTLGIKFKFDNEIWKYPLYDFNKEASLKDIDITLCGPELSKKVQNKIKRMLKNDNVHFASEKLEETKNQEQTEEKQETNKTTLIADDIIEEIKSIDYFGINKEKVNRELKSIIDKYNEDLEILKGSNKGLTLQSNDGLYTNLLVKLNLLKDSLYQKFEQNLDVYDMLDEANILLSVLNNEEVIINTSLEEDFYSLSKNILPFVLEKITDDLRNYLESEKQKLENYLLTGENKPYEDMAKFILSIRTYLNITLLSIRNYLNKEEILEVIKDYTNMQMQINYQEPIKNYLSILLQEIDKTKNEILNIDKNADIDNILNMLNINFYELESMEIIEHLTNIFNKLYRFYLNVKYERDLDLKMESYKIKL